MQRQTSTASKTRMLKRLLQSDNVTREMQARNLMVQTAHIRSSSAPRSSTGSQGVGSDASVITWMRMHTAPSTLALALLSMSLASLSLNACATLSKLSTSARIQPS